MHVPGCLKNGLQNLAFGFAPCSPFGLVKCMNGRSSMGHSGIYQLRDFALVFKMLSLCLDVELRLFHVIPIGMRVVHSALRTDV